MNNDEFTDLEEKYCKAKTLKDDAAMTAKARLAWAHAKDQGIIGNKITITPNQDIYVCMTLSEKIYYVIQEDLSNQEHNLVKKLLDLK